MQQLHVSNLTFTYDSLTSTLIDCLSFTAPRGWTGIVGPNGSGKTTLLRLVSGDIKPHAGTIDRPKPVLSCDQRTDLPPAGLDELLAIPDADAGRLVSILDLGGDWPYRWDTLSHGERKRAQVALALWHRPATLVLDEPTNHLDAHSRSLVAEGLERFDGVGLIVSHDRALLDRICNQCLFLDTDHPPVMRPGGVSHGMEAAERERLEAQRTFDTLRRQQKAIEREASRRVQKASVQDRRRSKRGLDRKDSDGREKIDRARVAGADGKAGRLVRQLDGRRERAARALSEQQRPARGATGITVHGAPSRRDRLLFRQGGALALPEGSRVFHPDLTVSPSDRIGIVGPNGAGKSTLVRSLIDESPLAPEFLIIPQEVSAREATALVEAARELPGTTLGEVASAVARLGSKTERLFETGIPSPGETRKLALALGLLERPSLVIMDEPTNHLDLVSIACIEEALSGYNGALLLVSHDLPFLKAFVDTWWEFDGEGALRIRAEAP